MENIVLVGEPLPEKENLCFRYPVLHVECHLACHGKKILYFSENWLILCSPIFPPISFIRQREFSREFRNSEGMIAHIYSLHHVFFLYLHIPLLCELACCPSVTTGCCIRFPEALEWWHPAQVPVPNSFTRLKTDLESAWSSQVPVHAHEKFFLHSFL